MRRKITYDPLHDYYVILGVEVNASPAEIRRAYRQAVRRVHPDLHPELGAKAHEQLRLINEAHDILSEPDLRREYDRVRWTHAPPIPRSAPRTTYHSPFSAPAYDPDRPWWEQAGGPAARDWTSDSRPPHYHGAITHAPPYWLQVSAWLRAHHLARLDHLWLTLVGLWRSPYAGVLSVLSVALAVNVAFIIYAFITPGGSHAPIDLREWFSSSRETATSVATVTAPAPFDLYGPCPDGVTITSPDQYDRVGDRFAVIGTVNAPDTWNYTVLLGGLDTPLTVNSRPEAWVTLRLPEANQNLPEIVVDGVLVPQVNLSDYPAGFYVISLEVRRRDHSVLPACNRVIYHERRGDHEPE